MLNLGDNVPFPHREKCPLSGEPPTASLPSPEKRLTRTLRNRIRSLDRRHAWRYTENRGGNHENRSDRRQWTDRVKARYQVARARARFTYRISQFRRQHT